MNLKTGFDVAEQPQQYMEGECPICHHYMKIPIATETLNWRQAYEDMLKEKNQLIGNLMASVRRMHQEICDITRKRDDRP